MLPNKLQLAKLWTLILCLSMSPLRANENTLAEPLDSPIDAIDAPVEDQETVQDVEEIIAEFRGETHEHFHLPTSRDLVESIIRGALLGTFTVVRLGNENQSVPLDFYQQTLIGSAAGSASFLLHLLNPMYQWLLSNPSLAATIEKRFPGFSQRIGLQKGGALHEFMDRLEEMGRALVIDIGYMFVVNGTVYLAVPGFFESPETFLLKTTEIGFLSLVGQSAAEISQSHQKTAGQAREPHLRKKIQGWSNFYTAAWSITWTGNLIGMTVGTPYATEIVTAMTGISILNYLYFLRQRYFLWKAPRKPLPPPRERSYLADCARAMVAPWKNGVVN